MAEVIRNRTIRPSSRQESSTYKINTKTVGANDELVVNINHETKSFFKSFRFSGKDLAMKNSIHFSVYESGSTIEITWSGAMPIK
jgi:hypothetical protein